MLTIAPGVELDVQRGPNWLLVRIDNLDAVRCESIPLADEIWELLQRHFIWRLVLDMGRSPALNRHLINELLDLHRRITAKGGVMRICHVSPRDARVLTSLRLDDRLTPYSSWEEAVRGSGDVRKPR